MRVVVVGAGGVGAAAARVAARRDFAEALVLATLRRIGLDRTDPVDVRGVRVAPRDVVAACLPDPATLGDRMRGRTCAGVRVTDDDPDGHPREVYLYQLADNEESMARDGAQAVVWQAAVNPVVALELLAAGTWSGAGVLGPEALDPVPFLDLLTDYGAPWHVQERTPARDPARDEARGSDRTPVGAAAAGPGCPGSTGAGTPTDRGGIRR